ncbi:DDB1- and CUL4-associated factor 17-like [Gigantopelta aegis]|uniref:DDB1- and CUL4-associated factor 17-like n=1 Tax=Gigantopelta aegis TaxID=1735272 RepID=UPI001B88B40B|nr:DDB1- and CUL4-associated factor 17-like [Gigantopelta aegis]
MPRTLDYLTNINATGNVFFVLRSREYALHGHQHKNFGALRTLICRGNTTYKKVWEKKSGKHISSERKYLYFENYAECYGGSTKSLVPRLLYKLPPAPKIEDALLCSNSGCLPPRTDAGKDSVMTISKNQYLVQYHLRTGREIQRIFVNSLTLFKLRDISWNNSGRSIVLKATPTNLHHERTTRARVTSLFILFDVFPLEFVGQMEIDRTIFGFDQTAAMVTTDMLIVMYQSGYIKIYSIPYIIDKYRMYSAKLNEIVPNTQSVCGQCPDGIPINIKLTECPPVLLSVRAADQDLQIGGFPWHYLMTPYGHFSEYSLYSVATHKLADNGTLVRPEGIYLPDHAIFHGDESGRIIYAGSEEVSVFKISSEDGSESRIEMLFTINVNTSIPDKKSVIITSSGRTSDRQRTYDDEFSNFTQSEIHGVEYEDELDILSVAYVTETSEDTHLSTLGLYDNLTGQKLRDVTLEMPYPEYNEHKVVLDLDTITETIKSVSGNFTCIIYKLVCLVQDEEETVKRQRKSETRKRSHRTRLTY